MIILITLALVTIATILVTLAVRAERYTRKSEILGAWAIVSGAVASSAVVASVLLLV